MSGSWQKARNQCQIRSDALAEANQKLRELDQMKTRFLLTVTHELRAPVAAIQSFLDLILQGYVEPERVNEVLQRSRNRTAELLDLISDLLQMARIRELDIQHVQIEPVDTAAVMEEVFRAASWRGRGKGTDGRYRRCAGTPPSQRKRRSLEGHLDEFD